MPRKYEIGIGVLVRSFSPHLSPRVTRFLAVSQTVEMDLFAFPYVA